MEVLSPMISGVISGLFTAGVVWGVLKTELKYLRRDVDHAHRRLDSSDGLFHRRISDGN